MFNNQPSNKFEPEVEALLQQLKLPEMRKKIANDNIDYVLHAVPLRYSQAKLLIKWQRHGGCRTKLKAS